MKNFRAAATAVLVALAALTAGCAGPDYRPVTAPSYYNAYGVVESIDIVRSGSSDLGAGTVLGGVVGGVLGNQIGSGRGNTAATILGTVGGAMLGHQMEKTTRDSYRVGVRFENGARETFILDRLPDLRIGDRVRVENNQLLRY